MRTQLRTCPSCFGHGRLYLRAGGRQLCGADGRQLTIPCCDCRATGLIPACPPTAFAIGVQSYAKALRDLEMVKDAAGVFELPTKIALRGGGR